MENKIENMNIFDMDALFINLPQKRGLSRYYSGKSRSFACLADVQTLDDLKKPDHQEPKKRKNYTNKDTMQQIPPFQCRQLSGNTQPPMPCIGA